MKRELLPSDYQRKLIRIRLKSVLIGFTKYKKKLPKSLMKPSSEKKSKSSSKESMRKRIFFLLDVMLVKHLISMALSLLTIPEIFP
jgi:hypothetical protein